MALRHLAAAALMFGLLFVEASAEEATPAPREADIPFRMLNGLEVVRYDANKLVIYRGSAADNRGRTLIQVPRSIFADITAVGPNGRDNVATPEDIKVRAADMQPEPSARGGYLPLYKDGHRYQGLPLSGWYMPVYAADADGNSVVFLTRQQSSQRLDRSGDAQIQAQFIARRNAPIAYYYDPGTGFRPMVCYGWPKPLCTWVWIPPFEDQLSILKAGNSNEITEVDAKDFVPPIGRILRIQVVARGTGGGGEVRLYTLAKSKGMLAAVVNGRGDATVETVDLVLNSGRSFYYSVDKGVEVDFTALGFSILQPN